MNKETEIKNYYLKNFNNHINAGGNDLISFKEKAAESFESSRFPNKKDEEWKYLNINPLIKNRFTPVLNLPEDNVRLDITEDYAIKNFDAYKFIFINGIFNKELSDNHIFTNGIIAGNLLTQIENNNSLIKKIIGNKNFSQSNIFNLLNDIFINDGFVLYVPERTTIDKPVHILNIAYGTGTKPLIQPRNFIHLEKNTQAEIIFEYVGHGDNKYFTNIFTEIVAEENSVLNIYKLQNESANAFHIERTDILQKDSCKVKHFSLSFGADISRNDINVKLDGENIESNLYGLYLGNKNQQIDHHTFIEHTKPNSNSNELYKGILDDNAKGIFSGKILVQKEAQKTNAFQSNKSVLLSDKATSNAKPQLEIYADDVKCSHGATVGKLNEEALFYIRSRGVSPETARSMLIRAFIDDVVKEINPEQLKEKVNHTIFQHLKRMEF